MHIAIIGAGAAGCFAAINIKRMMPSADITIMESGKKPLAKVAITGGGRCNLTNSFNGVRSLAAVYPRGERLMKRLLHEFSHTDTYQWFENEGVKLLTQDDECVFPVSQNAMEIVDTLVRLIRKNGIRLWTECRVCRIYHADDDKGARANNGRFRIQLADKAQSVHSADVVLVTTGGSPRISGFDMLNSFRLDIVEPVPSLFSVCIPDNDITKLMGTVVENASVCIPGTKQRATGSLLITHWGMSGPAILKLSSYNARTLHDSGYKARISVNWLGDMNETEVAEYLTDIAAANPKKHLASVYPQQLNARLWMNLLEQSSLKHEQRWGELGRKSINRLAGTLTNNLYNVNGKNRFKEEFVTCGGVALGNINPRTMECRTQPGLYFAGEVLDVDAITGGFNLQAAWTMGYVAAKAIADS